MAAKTVDDIVRAWLDANGYDGLVEEDGECACELADLAPCGDMKPSCKAGWFAPCGCGDGHDFHITEKVKTEWRPR